MAARNGRPVERNMAEKAVNDQKAAEGQSALAKMFAPKQTPHKAIIKSLEDIGVRVRVMPVMLGDEATDCLVIPIQELIIKEYTQLSGVDISKYQEQANLAPAATEENATDE